MRYFNVYGPRSESSAYSGVIRKFAERLVRMEGPIIYGTGKQTRDFAYVDDVVRANMLAASNERACGKIYNVASGVPTSIEHLADVLSDLILGKTTVVPHEYRPKSHGERDQGYADISLICSELGYHPKISIEEGLGFYLDSLGARRVSVPEIEVSSPSRI